METSPCQIYLPLLHDLRLYYLTPTPVMPSHHDQHQECEWRENNSAELQARAAQQVAPLR
jgi:hypothetical protein